MSPVGGVVSIARRAYRKLSPTYSTQNGHVLKYEFESFGTFESQGSGEYTCVSCGESHAYTSSFSAECGTGEPNTGGEEVTLDAQFVDHTRHAARFRILVPESEMHTATIHLPRRHETYDVERQQRLEELTPGTYHRVTFVSDNGDGTRWYCGGLEPLSQ